MHDYLKSRRETLVLVRGSALGVVACLLLSNLIGCNSLGRRKTQGNAIAAREMTRLGQEAMVDNRWQEAETRLGHAVELCPEDVTARRHYAHSLWRLGQKDEAIEQLSHAVQRSGGDPNWTVELGTMLLEQNQLEQADAAVRQAIDVDEQLASAWELKANVLLRQGNEDEALNSFHRARSLGAVNSDLLSNMAAIYEHRERPHRVLATLRRLEGQVGIQKMDSADLQRKGLALRRVGRLSEAIDTLAMAHQRSPQDQELLIQLADCQFAAGRVDDASSSLVAANAMGDLNQLGNELTANLHTFASKRR